MPFHYFFLLRPLRRLRPLRSIFGFASEKVGNPFSSMVLPSASTAFFLTAAGENGVSPTFLMAGPSSAAFIDSKDGKPAKFLNPDCRSSVVCIKEKVLFVHQ